MKIKIGILGYGEIGSAIEKVYLGKTEYDILVKDLDRDDNLFEVDYLHICIPFSNKFVEQVCNAIKEISPKTVIINSTVVPGTTRNIVQRSSFERVCHSPVRGVHPNLYEGLKTFEKYVGVIDNSLFAKEVSSHFNDLEIKTRVVFPTEASELAKIASTTYYGLCIAWHGEMASMCDNYGVDFEDVMTAWNTGYNQGYQSLGMNNV